MKTFIKIEKYQPSYLGTFTAVLKINIPENPISTYFKGSKINFLKFSYTKKKDKKMLVQNNQLTKYYKTNVAKANEYLEGLRRQTPEYLSEIFDVKINLTSMKTSQEDKRAIKKNKRGILKYSKLNVLSTNITTEDGISSIHSNSIKEKTNRLKVGSFCTGMGAMPTALVETGVTFDFEYSCEIDKFCHQTIKQNFPNLKKQYGDIFDIDPTLLPYVDVMEAGFPCTSFSIAGLQRGFSDEEKGTIIFKLIDIIVSLIKNNKAPTTILLENVKNIISHDKKTGKYDSLYNSQYTGKKQIGHTLYTIENLFQRLLEQFYDITWSVENTLDYSLPQNRERWFCVMTLKSSEFTFDFKNIQRSELTTSLKDYLDDKKDVPLHYYCQDISLIPGSEKKYKNSGKIEVLGDLEGYSYGQSKRVQGVNKSARCLTTGEGAKYLVDKENFLVRTLTVDEKLRLHGFPEWFKWDKKTSRTQKHKQLGNTISVMPLVAIFRVIFNSTNTPEKSSYTIKKSIINKPDMQYLNITAKKYQKYMKYINNDGNLFVHITKYKNMSDKKNKINATTHKVEVLDLLPKGYRNKPQGVRRYKIVSHFNNNMSPVNNINCMPTRPKQIKNNVLYGWVGSKNKFTPQIQKTLSDMHMQKTEYFVDAFGGSMNFTINNIEKINAKHYVLNDLDPLLVSTYKAIKTNYKKVQRLYMEIKSEFMSTIPEEFRHLNAIPTKDRARCKGAREFYMNTVDSINEETNIYKIAAIFIWKMQHTTNSMIKYKNKKISNVNYNWKFKTKTKLLEMAYYSSVLNRYDVIIENNDVFELIKKYSYTDTFIYLDPPYLNTEVIYNADNSNDFQVNLLKETNKYRYRLYSNEDCKNLYSLGLNDYFDCEYTFNRKNQLGKKQEYGQEYLAFSINNEMRKVS